MTVALVTAGLLVCLGLLVVASALDRIAERLESLVDAGRACAPPPRGLAPPRPVLDLGQAFREALAPDRGPVAPSAVSYEAIRRAPVVEPTVVLATYGGSDPT